MMQNGGYYVKINQILPELSSIWGENVGKIILTLNLGNKNLNIPKVVPMDKSLTLEAPATHSSWLPWVMLPGRLVLFAAFQAFFALGYLLFKANNAWEASAAWWPFTVTLTNLVCIAVLIHLFAREGKSYFSLFRIRREDIKKDLLTMLWVFLIIIPVAMLPIYLVAIWLFGSTTAALNLFIRHLPTWAAVASLILFPITQGLAELVTYFLYIEPRVEEQLGVRWLAVSVAALALGIQHVAVPLLFNGRFMLWRMLMFIPFALMLGIVLRWRPRLLPYLAIIHVLMDMSTATMLLTV